MLEEKDYAEIRKELEECTKPLFLYHDDPDGLSSFLLLYRYAKEGKGIVVKRYPVIDETFVKNIEEYGADKVFIVDIAIVEQEFIDKAKVPIIWIDHHSPLKRHKIKYYNPRVSKKDDNIPASYLCYRAVKQDLWIAMVGMTGDWYVSEYAKEFSKKNPKLLPEGIDKPQEVLFKTKLGKLARVFSFVLKGQTKDAYKCAKILTRVKSPEEILEEQTPATRFMMKKYRKINAEYEELLKDAVSKIGKEKVIVYTYPSSKMSFTGDLSNEILSKYPHKVIIIAREKSGEMKASLRSPSSINLQPIIQKALEGTEGYGGGHEHAGGANIKEKDWKKFIDSIKEHIE